MKPTTQHVFKHHLYEYKKGVRHLFMMTVSAAEAAAMAQHLASASIDHYLQELSPQKANLFFGRAAVVEATRRVVTKPLNLLSPEEDFILGSLLGYDKEQQCLRYLAKKGPVVRQ